MPFSHPLAVGFLLFCTFGCLVAASLLSCRGFLAELSERVRRLPPVQLAVLLVALMVATVNAQKAGTNETDHTGGGTNLMSLGFFPTSMPK